HVRIRMRRLAGDQIPPRITVDDDFAASLIHDRSEFGAVTFQQVVTELIPLGGGACSTDWNPGHVFQERQGTAEDRADMVISGLEHFAVFMGHGSSSRARGPMARNS